MNQRIDEIRWATTEIKRQSQWPSPPSPAKGVIVKKIPVSSQLNDLLYFARICFEEYPYSTIKDPGYFELLLDEFPDLDLLYEIRLYHAWTLDQTGCRPFPYRLLFRLWLMHSRAFGGIGVGMFYDKGTPC